MDIKDENNYIINCDDIDYRSHSLNSFTDEHKYIVCSLILHNTRTFNSKEWPLIIRHNKIVIYKDPYFSSNYMEVLDYINSIGTKVVIFGYDDNDKDFFSNKYFEVLV